MTIIKHHTKLLHVQEIFNDHFIDVEGCNVEKMIKDENFHKYPPQYRYAVSKAWRTTKYQYKNIGRYVWFTEEDQANCCNSINPRPTVSFSFDAEEIGALRWTAVRAVLVGKKGSGAKKIIRLLEKAAIKTGDDPERWWVSKQPISLDHWLYENDPWFDPAWIVAANDDEDQQLAA